MDTEDRARIKKIIIETLKPLKPTRIGIFGSFARGDWTSTSDIDILVKLPSANKREPIGLLWFSIDLELEKKLGRSVDLVSEDALSGILRPEIERDLEVIYEKAG
jgi:predicted nucleotidyltransferase